jgi:hypothetical protein
VAALVTRAARITLARRRRRFRDMLMFVDRALREDYRRLMLAMEAANTKAMPAIAPAHGIDGVPPLTLRAMTFALFRPKPRPWLGPWLGR